MKKWIPRVLGTLLILVFFYFLIGCEKKKPEIKLVTAALGDIQEKALAVGTIEPEQEIKVKSTISGIVSEVLFKVGDTVKAGDPLFKISPNPTPLEYVESRRSMEHAELTMRKLQRDWDRQKELYEKSLISKSDMDAIDNSFKEATLLFKTASERLELLEKGRISMSNREINSIIKSPISGIVLSQSVFLGDPVVPLTQYQPGTELCSLADMASLLFKGTVDEIDVGKIIARMPAEITIGALPEARIKGVVERIYPKAKKDGNATLFDIEISIDKSGGLTLRAGFSATASIRIQDRRQVIVLPERLVLFEGGKRFVEVPEGTEKELVRGGKTRKVEVQTGLSDGLNIEIVSGLKEGEKVVERPPREIK